MRLSDFWLFALLLGVGAFLAYSGRRHSWARYAFRRYLLSLASLVLVSLFVFSLMEVLPGDCAEKMIAYKSSQGEIITQADIDAERARMGLDRPLPVRWFLWLSELFLHGDLGFSCNKRQPIAMVLGDRFWLSFWFCIAAQILAYLVAVPLGIFAGAVCHKPWIDRNPIHGSARRTWNSAGNLAAKVLDGFLRMVGYLGLALPNFLLAVTIILLFVFSGKPTPIGLFSPEWQHVPWFRDGAFQAGKLMDLLRHVWLPVFVIGWSAVGLQLQTVRALVADEVNKLYVDAARARGLSGVGLWWRYPVRHALPPAFNSMGFDFQRIFNDLPIVAVVLGMTEAGALLIEALAQTNDQQLASAILFLVALVVVGMNFATDLILAWVDPRMALSLTEE